jgi:uncharacterized protein
MAVMISAILTSCVTYYQKTLQFQEYIRQGALEKADKWLDSNHKEARRNSGLLYFFNRGSVARMLGDYERSIGFFSEADRMIEDYLKSPGAEVMALLTNPGVRPYQPEDFEVIMLNYYQALNFLQLGDYEKALVECRRINLRLQQLNDRYKDHTNKYQRDAFAHVVMGLIYEADRDFNNAFIAYRNALTIYETDYAGFFNIQVPGQLKSDLLRTAYLTGFDDQVRYYEEKFRMKYQHTELPESELVIFWLNGFGPVKNEWSINFTTLPGQEGWVTIVNEELNMSFPVYIGNRSNDEKNAIEQLRFFRVAFPKYSERKPVFERAFLSIGNHQIELQKLQNVNDIAFKSLNDRMLREMSMAVARLVTKKALEALADKENKSLGTVVSILGAVTEKADTRNWQTLPYSIHYARVPLEGGSNELLLTTQSPMTVSRETNLRFEGKPGRMIFHSFHSLESFPPGM